VSCLDDQGGLFDPTPGTGGSTVEVVREEAPLARPLAPRPAERPSTSPGLGEFWILGADVIPLRAGDRVWVIGASPDKWLVRSTKTHYSVWVWRDQLARPAGATDGRTGVASCGVPEGQLEQTDINAEFRRQGATTITPGRQARNASRCVLRPRP
jgi:hypothetical protein